MKRIFILLAGLLLVTGCQKRSIQKPKQLRVTTTIAPHAYFANRIGNNKLDVTSILPPSVDIHTFEPSPQSMENLKNIDLWIQIGAPFEDKITPIITKLNPNITILNLSEKIPLLPINSDTKFLTPCKHSRDDRDMHTWMSPTQAENSSRIIAQSLVNIDRIHSHEYSEGLNSLLDDLADLDRTLRIQFKNLIGSAIIVAHPSLGYFCNDYQLKQYSIECEGKEPLPQDLQNLTEQIKKEHVLCIFSQKGFDSRGARLIAKKLQLPLYELDPFAWDYPANIKKLGEEIANAQSPH